MDFYYLAGSGVLYTVIGNGSAESLIAGGAAPAETPFVAGFTINNLQVTNYFNNTTNGSGPASTQGDAGAPMTIGRRSDGVVAMEGDIAEILIYDRAVSDGERSQIMTYLADKWAIPIARAVPSTNFVPPTVTITSPANSTNTASSIVSFAATATSSDSSIVSVAFIANGTTIATLTSAPYQTLLQFESVGSYTLTAVATDASGMQSTSDPVVVDVTGTNGPLAITNGLKLWLAGDVGVQTDSFGDVINWLDQSPDGNNAAPLNPEYAPTVLANGINGKPVVNFDGVSGQMLEVTGDTNMAFTAGNISTFYVTLISNYGNYRGIWSKIAPSTAPAPVDFYYLPGSGVFYTVIGNGSAQSFIAGGAAPTETPFVAGFTINNLQVTNYFNNTTNGSGPAAIQGDAGAPMTIGQRSDGAVTMEGDIAEILIYDRAVSDGERIQIMSYLADKWAIPIAQAVPSTNLVPPMVTITSPSNSTNTPSSIVSFAATATSSESSIVSVAFIANGTTIATLTNAPYQAFLEFESVGSYTLTAVATDASGLKSTSDPVVVDVTGTNSPLAITDGLKLWLAGDVGVQTNSSGDVISWLDQSPDGNNATLLGNAAAPTLLANGINGKPVVNFDGVSGQMLEVTGDSNMAFTAGNISTFYVTLISNYGNYRGIWSKIAPAPNSYPAPVDFYYVAGSGLIYTAVGNGSSQSIIAGGAAPTETPFVAGFTINNLQVTNYFNNTTNGSGPAAIQGDGGAPMTIGQRRDGVVTMEGDIAEILIYDRAVSDGERIQIMSYLADKWAIPIAQAVPSTNLVPPMVTITSPSNSTNTPSSIVSFAATATSSESSIVSVAFIANGTTIATLTNAPYQAFLEFESVGSYTLTAVATDASGLKSTSDPVVVDVTGTNSPLAITDGLKLWLAGDVGVQTNSSGDVISWLDQSPDGNNATLLGNAAAPTLLANGINGKPVVNFDGVSGQMLEVTGDSNMAFTAGNISTFYVTLISNYGNYRGIWSKIAPSTAPAPVDFYYLPGSGVFYTVIGNGSAQSIIAGGAAPAETPFVAGFTINNLQVTNYFNNTTNGSGPAAIQGDAGTPMTIGQRSDGAVTMEGDIAEILIYDRAVSDGERSQIMTYLADKWAIPIAQAVPQQPTLTVTKSAANTIQLSWGAGYTGFILEGSTNLASPAWIPVATNPPNNQVSVTATSRAEFFRLRSQ